MPVSTNPVLQGLENELSKHMPGSVAWLQIIAEIVAILNGILNPPTPAPTPAATDTSGAGTGSN